MLGYGELTPGQKALRERAGNLWAEYESLKIADQVRLASYRDWIAEYESQRTQVAVGSPTDDYGRKKQGDDLRRHDIKLPYGHAITVKHSYRVAGQPPDIFVERRDSSPPERFRADTIAKILYSIYGSSDSDLQFASGSHDGSLLGAGCYDVYWNQSRNMPRFRSIFPGSVLTVAGTEEPHEFSRVYRFWHVSHASFKVDYGNHTFPAGDSLKDVKCDAGTDKVTMVKYSDDTETVVLAGGVVLSVTQHNYGFTPYVVIPNLGPVRKIWGYGDYEFYRQATRYYEQLVSRQADVIRAAANGAYVDENTGQSPNAVKRILQSGGIIPARKDGKLVPVEVAQMPAFVSDHFTMVRQAIDDLGFVPAAAWGAPGSGSGSDRALQMAPQVELTALKQIHWSSGLKRLNAMLLQLVEKKTVGEKRYTGGITRRSRTDPFSITVNAATSEQLNVVGDDGNPITDENGQPYQVPQNPAELIAGEYDTRMIWQRRIDRDDPAYILAELNKFQQGAQSLYTTLQHLGIESPEDEIRLIQQEAEEYPWMRSGMIALIQQQLDAANQQGGGGGGGSDIAGALSSMSGGGGGGSGALNFDSLSQGLNGNSQGGDRRSASAGPSGAPYGGA